MVSDWGRDYVTGEVVSHSLILLVDLFLLMAHSLLLTIQHNPRIKSHVLVLITVLNLGIISLVDSNCGIGSLSQAHRPTAYV